MDIPNTDTFLVMTVVFVMICTLPEYCRYTRHVIRNRRLE
jgi:hypothetical protein